MSLNATEVKSLARACGFERIGIAKAGPAMSIAQYADWVESGFHGTMQYMENSLELRSDPRKLLASAKSVIVVAVPYGQPRLDLPGEPKIAQYALGRDYHKVIRSKMRKLVRKLHEHSPDAEFRSCIDSAPILEREWAHRAGLGWYGKNTCLIDSKSGSFFFIAVLLSSIEIEPDVPSVGGCGTCQKCIDACPTGALVFHESRWQLQASRCISYLTIEHRGEIALDLGAQMNDWTFGCDICQDVCPFNERRDSQPDRNPITSDPEFAPRQFPSLLQLAQINEEDWDVLTQGSALRRATYKGLKRNAQLNLQNEQNKESPPAV